MVVNTAAVDGNFIKLISNEIIIQIVDDDDWDLFSDNNIFHS